MAIKPKLSGTQTAADLAEQSGISQEEVMQESQNFPDLQPDALIGNILSRRSREQAGQQPAQVPTPLATGGNLTPTTEPLEPTATRQPGESITDFVSRTSPEGTFDGTSPVATSDSLRTQIRERVRGELLPEGTLPEAPSSAEARIRLRKEQGIVNDEQDLSDLRQEARLAEQELREFRSRVGQAMPEGGRIGAITEAERNLSFRLEGLAIRERALVERVNSKNAFINQAIQDQQLDFQNALAKWNTEFSINAKMTDLVNQELDDIQKDALTTVTTIQNLMGETGLPFEQWPEEMKIQAENAAMKAGLPKDTFSVAYGAQNAGEKVLTNIVQENLQGGKDVYVVTQGPEGISMRRVGSTDPAPRDFEAPVIKEFNGIPHQWNSNTGVFEPVNVEAINNPPPDPLAIESAEDKLALIDDVMSNRMGFLGTVGVFEIQKWKPLLQKGARIDFINDVDRLISQETLDTLVNLKQQGGTLGALSDSERLMLRNAATSLGNTIQRDRKGNITGFLMTQESFIEEVKRIRTLAERALQRATGGTTGEADTMGQVLQRDGKFYVGNPSGGFDETEIIERDGQRFIDIGGGTFQVFEPPQQQSGFNGDLSRSKKGSVLGLGPITGFGSPFWKHGLDIDLKIGDPVPTPESGEVIFAGSGGGFGNQVKIRTDRGNEIWLSHLASAGVRVGDRVTRGQIIGKGGNTGKVIPGPQGDGSHLDLTVKRPDGSYMTPQEIAKILQETNQVFV